jgi:hypothetical protein
MDIALASIIMCVSNAKISLQENSVKSVCQGIMEIQPMEDNVQVSSLLLFWCIFANENIEKEDPVVENMHH